MSEPSADFAKTIRAEVNALLGIRWDSLVEWIVITWLSAWFWATMIENLGTSSGEWYGPLAGIELFFEELDISSPEWFSGFLDWLHDPAHAWIYFIFLLSAVTTCVTAARSYRHTGLRSIALLSTAIACEMNGSLSPVIWVLLLAAIPALWACGIAFVGQLSDERQPREYRYYFAEGIVLTFLTRILFLFMQPPAAPFLIVAQLVVSFRTDLPYYPAEGITREVIAVATERDTACSSELDPLTAAASSAAIGLAGNQSREAREVLSAYHFALAQRRKIENAKKLQEAKSAQRFAEFRH